MDSKDVGPLVLPGVTGVRPVLVDVVPQSLHILLLLLQSLPQQAIPRVSGLNNRTMLLLVKNFLRLVCCLLSPLQSYSCQVCCTPLVPSSLLILLGFLQTRHPPFISIHASTSLVFLPTPAYLSRLLLSTPAYTSLLLLPTPENFARLPLPTPAYSYY